MIEPNRYGPVLVRPRYHEMKKAPECALCTAIAARDPSKLYQPKAATCLAWGNRPFCDKCYAFHKQKKGLSDRYEKILRAGEGVQKMTLIPGKETIRPELFDQVQILYEMRVAKSGSSKKVGEIVDSSAMRGNRPLIFKSGGSGPCLHLQILSAHRLHRGSIFDVPDPYCVVYWNNRRVGKTLERPDTTDPVWEAETLVIPLQNPLLKIWLASAALKGKTEPPAGVNEEFALHQGLRIEVYDNNTFRQDEFLGQVGLTPAQLVRSLANDEAAPRVHPLRPKSASGCLSISLGRTISLTQNDKRLFLVCKLFGASALWSGGNIPPNPSVMAFWDGASGETTQKAQYLGETPLRKATTEPTWTEALFVIPLEEMSKKGPPISLSGLERLIGQRQLRLEVRDARGKFLGSRILGQVSLNAEQIIEFVRATDDATRRAPPASLEAPLPKSSVKNENDFPALSVPGLSRGESSLQDSTPQLKKTQSSFLSSSRNFFQGQEQALKKIIFSEPKRIALVLTEEHNASDRVQGTLGMRILYHTRGEILRGIDVGVAQMALGERAVLRIRPDYAFDSAMPGPLIPPYSTLQLTVDLLAVRNHSARFLFMRRAAMSRLRLWRHQVRNKYLAFERKNPKLAATLALIYILAWPIRIILRYILGLIILLVTCRRNKRLNWIQSEGLERSFSFSSSNSLGTICAELDDKSVPPENDDAPRDQRGDQRRRSDDNNSESGSDDQDDAELWDKNAFDLLDFDDAFTDDEIEAARKDKIRAATTLFRHEHFNVNELTSGLGHLSSASIPRSLASLREEAEEEEEADSDYDDAEEEEEGATVITK